MELISCIIPTYNRVNLLKEAIESTIKQTYTNWELIVVDDGSVDETFNVVWSYVRKDNRIKYYKNPRKGGAAARNFGLSKATGEFVAFLDDDDVNLPHRFESQLKAAQKSGSLFVVSGYEVRDRNTNKLRATVKLELKGMGAGFPSRWLIKKELLEKVDGFNEDFPSMQDIELSYRLAGHEVFVLHDDIVSIIYQTDNSVSTHKGNAVVGKVLLMERLGAKMHPVEASWWNFVIALDYNALCDYKKALYYLLIASETNLVCKLRFAYLIAKMFLRSGNPLNIIILKILRILRDRKFPEIVEHPVV